MQGWLPRGRELGKLVLNQHTWERFPGKEPLQPPQFRDTKGGRLRSAQKAVRDDTTPAQWGTRDALGLLFGARSWAVSAEAYFTADGHRAAPGAKVSGQRREGKPERAQCSEVPLETRTWV